MSLFALGLIAVLIKFGYDRTNDARTPSKKRVTDYFSAFVAYSADALFLYRDSSRTA